MMRASHRLAALLLVAFLAVMIIGPSPARAQGNPNPGVIPPASSPYGHTYGEWSNMWWQWLFGIEYGKSPAFDDTGTNCAQGQSGPVWFLAQSLAPPTGGPNVNVTRNCTVPPGKAIFFPIINIEADNIVPVEGMGPPPYTLGQLRDVIEGAFAPLGGCPGCWVKVDGLPLQGIFADKDRIGKGNAAFSITVPEDNVIEHLVPNLSVAAGTYEPVVGDGWYVMLAPLSAGQHTVQWHVAIPDTLDWTIAYNLTVGTGTAVGMPRTGAAGDGWFIFFLVALALMAVGLTFTINARRRVAR